MGGYMYKQILDFEIRPIFNLSDDICKEFERIELLCNDWLGGVYVPEYVQSCWKYHKESASEQNAFAFAGYYKNEIIGFSDGYVMNDAMKLDSLFVDPIYHCFGVGTKLLQMSEQSASLMKSDMMLIPLDNAMHFYQTHGYDYRKPGFYLSKKLSKPISGVIPVFEWSDELNAKLNLKVDTNLLKQYERQPVFVYLNKEQKIDGIATRLPDGKDFIKYNGKDKTLARYRELELSDALYKAR